MKHARLYVIVFIAGAAVLAVEIVGTRILGPFYGVSLFLWSALITVTLAALSAGYALGGRWADRGPFRAALAIMLAVAGLWLLLVPWLRSPVLRLTEGLGLRLAVLATATILFFPPLLFLGMVSPYAVRLKAARLDEVGRAAGDLYAVSTVASVLSALTTGFVLVPCVGVGRLTALIGLVLLLGALLAFTGSRRRILIAAPLLAALGAGLAAILGAPGEQPDPERGLVAVKQSPYADVRVVDWEDARYLLIDGGAHTLIERETGRSLFRYAVVMDLLKHLFDNSGRMLLVGLGGGSIARSFSASGWDVDAVEIDPVVPRFARRYFGLEPSDARVIHDDGRRYLARASERYELVILDAFGSSAVPFHLVTREAFALARRRLTPGGVLAVNIEALGWRDILVRSLAATLGEVFGHVQVLPTSEPPNVLGNMVILASDRALDFPEERLERPYDHLGDPYEHWAAVQRHHAWLNRFTPDPSGAPVLTDDHNPVDLWSERINVEARRVLHEDFAWRELVW